MGDDSQFSVNTATSRAIKQELMAVACYEGSITDGTFSGRHGDDSVPMIKVYNFHGHASA